MKNEYDAKKGKHAEDKKPLLDIDEGGSDEEEAKGTSPVIGEQPSLPLVKNGHASNGTVGKGGGGTGRRGRKPASFLVDLGKRIPVCSVYAAKINSRLNKNTSNKGN